ncbi:MAG: hypothetical protein ACOC4M_14140 [Promethearchaeia archaeon]
MSKLERAYVTSAGTTFKKVTAKDGRTMHFKDGKPIKVQSFNAGQNHIEYEGQNANVAIPSDKGPGYERIEVSPIEASALGVELNKTKENVRGTPMDQVMLNGKQYNINELAELNDDIIDRYGPDAVFKY